MQVVYTIGHSNRTFDDFVAMLKAHGVEGVVDVRRFAGSRKMPWFNGESLAATLPGVGMEYLPRPLLGGRRRSTEAGSLNTAWRNASFRAYADYMQTAEFLQGLGQLMDAARRRPVAMMCSEALPWRCHRSLVADALIVRGWEVRDVMSAKKAAARKLTPFAVVEGEGVTYPGEGDTTA